VKKSTKIEFGETRIFFPVCLREPLGFYGGPRCYREVPLDEIGECPIIIGGEGTPPEEGEDDG
jgi:hypothetical protein